MNLSVNKVRLFALLSWVIAYVILFFYVKSCSISHEVFINLIVSATDISCLLLCALLLRKQLIPNLLYKKRIIAFLLSLLLTIIFFSILMQILQSLLYQIFSADSTSQKDLFKNYYYQLFTSWWIVLCGCLCIIAYKLIFDYSVTQIQFSQLQKEKAQTELSFLKAQINPHFLFNSINSIFAHIDKSNSSARGILLSFSEMLRYQLYECNVDQINFDKEYTYLKNYVELQRLRKEDNLIVTFDQKGELNNFKIAPLLLIPFVENAFKYSSNHSDRKNILQIILSREENYFHFYCINTKDQILSRKLFEDSGIGISNVMRRLELIYPNKHDLTINDNEMFYEVNLKIEIQ
jgi:two-component system, LytTR family, sensor kinase